MNVIVSNKNQMLLANLQIDVIKSINGVFTVDDLAANFKNFFFNKMILDISSLENYEDIGTMQKMTLAFDMAKVIVLLDDSPVVNSPKFLSQLVSLGIYNFTTSIDNIPFLIDNPNSYKDVANYHNLNVVEEEEKPVLNDRKKPEAVDKSFGQKILGVKDLTYHAGATTLTYLLKKHIEKNYSVKAIEVGKCDFDFFNDKELVHVDSGHLLDEIDNSKDKEVILVDINDDEGIKYCHDVIYLVEPGLIPLNRLVRDNYHVFEDYKERKIVLNRSILNERDIADFERESGAKVFFNIPNVDDKFNNIPEINELLAKLGFTRFSSDNANKNKGFSIFH